MAISTKSDRLSFIEELLPEPDASGVSAAQRAVFLDLYNRSLVASSINDDRSQWFGLDLEALSLYPDPNGSITIDDRSQLLNLTRNVTTGGSQASLTGVGATASIGSLSLKLGAVVSVSGLSATPSVGTLSSSGAVGANPASVSSQSYVGLLSVNITGASLWWNGSWWNNSWWNAFWWNTESAVQENLAGNGLTASLGALSTVTGAVVDLSGVQAEGQIGGLSVTAGTSVSAGISGVSSPVSIGSVASVTSASYTLSGVAGTFSVGTFTVDTAPIGRPEAVSATASVGSLTVIASSITDIFGVSSTSQVGDPTATEVIYVPITADRAHTIVIRPENRVIHAKPENRTLKVRD